MRPLCRLSLLSLIFGLLGCLPFLPASIAILLGLIAIVQTIRRPLRGRAMALAGILLGTLSLFAWTSAAIFVNRAKHAKVDATKVQVAVLQLAVKQYRADVGQLPPDLNALVTPPDNVANWHPYIEKIPFDPWGNEYQYKIPGRHGPFDLWSLGADGRSGTRDDVNGWSK